MPGSAPSDSYRGLLRNCCKVKKLEWIGQADWGVGGVLRPIHHRSDSVSLKAMGQTNRQSMPFNAH